jgi:hypothetical protein
MFKIFVSALPLVLVGVLAYLNNDSTIALLSVLGVIVGIMYVFVYREELKKEGKL